MINVNALRETLIDLAEYAKNQLLLTASAMNEIAALREAISGLDPTVSDILKQKKLEAERNSSEALQIAVQKLDEKIRKLKVGQVC
jgi:dsDNA-specific endonuclease/ATPase MutS2